MDRSSHRTLPTRQLPCAAARARSRASRRPRGFTLVEAVVSAGLLGFLALTTTFFWVDNFTLAATVNTDTAAIADGRAALDRLEREIREVKFSTSTGAYCVSTMSSTCLLYTSDAADE